MSADEGLLPVGTPIDLDNCAREPIHIPGSVQPRGVLIVLREPGLVIQQVSANITDLLGVPVENVLGEPLAAAVGAGPAAIIERAAASFSDLRARNPLDVRLEVREELQNFDAILHRDPHGVLLLELELAFGPRPFSFPNTYLAVRGSVDELNRAGSMRELYDVTARAVRELTGFDRVMIYRYDEQYNGEVVAEARRADLNSFLGLHYPASDIPAQARALYEKNWIRLISDVDYAPSPIVPPIHPISGAPVDLTFSTLRSVSPIHIEYLKNMGVQASMSISLMRAGRLWGLIACHHYSGPHLPPYGTRAAAEFLGSTLSLRMGDQADDDELRDQLQTQETLAKIVAATLDESEPLAAALLGAPDLLDLVRADGVVVHIGSDRQTRGDVPEPADVLQVTQWARGTGEAVAVTDSLVEVLPGSPPPPGVASGALVVTLPDEQFIAWFRAEELHSVDWGGDPQNKAIAVQEGDTVRLSPRKSFERWRETVRDRSRPWARFEVDLAGQLQSHAIAAMYQRARSELRLAGALQRSLLPVLPTLPDWSLTASYEPAEGGRIGGDWYDAFLMPDGRLATVLGDVAGHGVAAAGRMAQLRNALRAYLFDGLGPDEALAKLNRFTTRLLGGVFATAVVACIDLRTGEVEAVSAGHPIPFCVDPTAGPYAAPVTTSTPIGLTQGNYRTSRFTLAPGAALVLFSDGLIERRTEDNDISRARLAAALASLDTITAENIGAVADYRDVTADDATILSVCRPH